jgi:ubiquinone/menaquinone biosynthesis C-methylase UbiE
MGSPEDFHHEHPDIFRRFRDSIGRTQEVKRYLAARGLLAGTRSLLSIGSGEGDLEIELAGSVDRIGAIDPDRGALSLFRAKLRERGLEDRLGLCIADRFETAAIPDRFDLVLAVHSWYAIGRDRDALARALTLREPTGTLALALASREGMTVRLKALGPRAETDPTAEEISAWASDQGFPHTFELCRNPKPAALFIDDAGLNEVGRALIGFLVSTPWEELSGELREAGERIVRSSVRGGEIESATGWLLFRAPDPSRSPALEWRAPRVTPLV